VGLVPLLRRPLMLVADLGTAAGRRSHAGDDDACKAFRDAWRRSQLLHPSMLAYTTSRSVLEGWGGLS
jgi:hypothetical protein